ncbi:MAG: hypothetical protein EBW87_02230 [Burkholderiaceae bacterium]|nr:hypothetical protein [Burkholderiaceae bacterium]
MRTQTFTKLRNTESKRAKFKIMDKAVVRYVHADDSNKLRERVGQTGPGVEDKGLHALTGKFLGV